MNPFDLHFSRKPSTLMHLDLNSCFATIEQQANPLLRGRPIAVAAYDSPRGCILAPSVEAKKYGVKVGMRVRDGQLLCPGLEILPPDPDKYRHVHLGLKRLLLQYTPSVIPKSIDEFVLNFEGCPGFKLGLVATAQDIKTKIRRHLGEWLTVSIGIGPNRFLAKLASNLHKPDGLDEVNHTNFKSVYATLSLTDLNGIKQANAVRLHGQGINTVLDFYAAPFPVLRSAFHSVCSYYWYLRLRGWEIDDVDFGRKSFSHMYSLPIPKSAPKDLSPTLHKLVEKLGFRLRGAGYGALGVHLGLLYRNGTFWHHGRLSREPLFDSRDIYTHLYKILLSSPYSFPVANISVSCFNLVKNTVFQPDLFGRLDRSLRLTKALDSVNSRWGNFVIASAAMINTKNLVPDRIGFGNVGNVGNVDQFIFNDIIS